MDIVNMTIGELAGWGTVGAIAISTVVQISPIKFNPWSTLAKFVGRAINGELLEKVERMEKDVRQIREEADEREAKAARSRILRFGDECMHNTLHSKEHFDQIMRDIKEYENYCDDHPKFENNTAVFTIKRINEIYQRRLTDNSFL